MRNLFWQGMRALAIVVLAVVVLVVIIGCGKSDTESRESTDSTSREKPEGVFTIGVSLCDLDEPRYAQVSTDIKAAADKHSNLRLVFKDARGDALRQCKHVKALVADQVDLMIVSPEEAQPLTEPVAKAYDAGTPVIVLDRPLIGDRYTCFIHADDVRIGKAAGQWLVEKLGGKGRVVELMGPLDSTPSLDRQRGFAAAIRDYPDIDVVFKADMKWEQSTAQREMETALERSSNIAAVYAHNDAGAYGAYLAAKAAGREKNIVFVGIGGLRQVGVAYVKDDILDASFEYPAGGRGAIDTALKVLVGEKVPKTIVLRSKYFTKENVDRGGEPIE